MIVSYSSVAIPVVSPGRVEDLRAGTFTGCWRHKSVATFFPRSRNHYNDVTASLP
jgi:hypothetical protein